MIILIGLVLLIYGFISYKYPFMKYRNQSNATMPDWLPTLQKVSGVLLMIAGGLLILTSLMLQ
ncbi:hypothetical protein GCM10008932_14920 [Alkalibacterium iburiense]|uniref:Immunity protein n=1 Tax=Alkalibacterium iburiense TaxID=290589 RepID=A0ABN0XGE0_9LACT